MQLCDLSDQRLVEFTNEERLLGFTNVQQKCCICNWIIFLLLFPKSYHVDLFCNYKQLYIVHYCTIYNLNAMQNILEEEHWL